MARPNMAVNTTTAPTTKTLHCIRHGPSEMNAYMNLHRYGSPHQEPLRDPMLFDAPLTSDGKAKAAALQGVIASFQTEPEIVLVSPLTRCLETATIAFDKLNSSTSQQKKQLRIVALPLLRERLQLSSEVGRPKSQLALEFPDIDFSLIPEEDGEWWFPQGASNKSLDIVQEPEDVYKQRRELRRSLAAREERCMTLVSHWGVLNWLTGQGLDLCGVVSDLELDLKEE